MNNDTRKFPADLGRRISSVPGDDRETGFFLMSTDFVLLSRTSSITMTVFLTSLRFRLSSFLYFVIFSYPHFLQGLK